MVAVALGHGIADCIHSVSSRIYVPRYWRPHLVSVNHAIGKLGPQDFFVFTTGDESEMLKVMGRDQALWWGMSILDAFYEGDGALQNEHGFFERPE